MLKENEYYYVECYSCETVEDDYEKGEVGDVCAYWSGKDFKSHGMKFKTIKDALAQILNEQCFDEKTWSDAKREWTDVFNETGDENERGRFDCDVTVDVDNTEATGRQIESWKKGELTLYNCHIVAHIGVRSERELTDEDYDGLEL